MSKSEMNHVDVLIVDNMGSQGRWIQDKIESLGLTCGIVLVTISKEELAKNRLPDQVARRVISEIRRVTPRYVLVDICLFEGVFPESTQSGTNVGTWTGPALMAQILVKCPNVYLASHSAYTVEKDFTDIDEQRKKWGVDKTPHWRTSAMEKLTSQTFEATMQLVR
jgi:hypothetical protein